MNWKRQSLLQRVVCAVGAALLLCVTAAAETTAIYTIATPAKASRQGNPVAAQVTIAVGWNQIHVVLTSLLNDPTSVGRALRSFFFLVDGGTAGRTLSSSSATSREIDANGSYANPGVAATGWSLLSSGNRMELCGIKCGAAGPSGTLIGAPGANGKYASSSSIAGSGTHSPFLVGNAVFDLAVTGVMSQSKMPATQSSIWR